MAGDKLDTDNAVLGHRPIAPRAFARIAKIGVAVAPILVLAAFAVVIKGQDLPGQPGDHGGTVEACIALCQGEVLGIGGTGKQQGKDQAHKTG